MSPYSLILSCPFGGGDGNKNDVKCLKAKRTGQAISS